MSGSCGVSGIILAGGKSKRFGSDKAFQVFEGQTLVERAAGRIRNLPDISELIIVTSDDMIERIGRLFRPPADHQTAPVRVISDRQAGHGPMGGIHAGLIASRNDYCLVVACDMPFLNTGLLGYMLGLRDGFDLVVPRSGGLPEPLHAVYGRGCLPAIERRLAEGRPMVYSLIEGVRTRFVEEPELDRFDPSRSSFLNINSIGDLERARSLAQEGAGTRQAP